MLSPRDVALVDGWREQGLPVRIALRVIEEGMIRFRQTHPRGASLPSTLAYFEQQMAEAASLRRSKLLDFAPGAGADPCVDASEDREQLVARLLDRITTWGRAMDDAHEEARAVLRTVWQGLKRAPADADLWALVAELDEALVDGLFAACDPERQARLTAEAEAEVAADGARLGAQARADRLRVALEGRVRGHFDVEDLMEVLLGAGL